MSRKEVKDALLQAFKDNWETQDTNEYDYKEYLMELSNGGLEKEYEKVFYQKIKIR